MSKKLISLLSLSTLLLVACSEETTTTEETTTEEAATTEETEETETAETETEETTEEEAGEVADEGETSFDGHTLVTDDITIEITDYRVLEPGEENNFGETPLLAFWYDTTVHEDVTETEYDPLIWISLFKAIQDNDPNAINELEVGILPDEAHLDSQMQTIKPGGTVSSSVSYELDDTDTPVELIVENIVTGEEYGSHTYDLN